jgi:hypothetical protein
VAALTIGQDRDAVTQSLPEFREARRLKWRTTRPHWFG